MRQVVIDPHEFSHLAKQNILHRIFNGCIQEGDHLMWKKSVNSSGYPQIRVKMPDNTRRVMLATRMLYAFQHNVAIGGEFTQDHISHRCSNKLCLKLDHLHLEPQAVNNQRKSCVANGFCHRSHNTEGRPYPPCIL
jgi:hypothetical protein